MEHQKILNLLNEASDFHLRQANSQCSNEIVNDQSNAN